MSNFKVGDAVYVDDLAGLSAYVKSRLSLIGRRGTIRHLHPGANDTILAELEEMRYINFQVDRLTPAATPEMTKLGMKFDTGKLCYTPLMRGLALPLRAVAAVLSYGKQKYAEDSWQEVPDAKNRYENAYYRHMNARLSGETYDEESGLPHMAHELCNLMFMLWFAIKDGSITNITEFNPPPERKQDD